MRTITTVAMALILGGCATQNYSDAPVSMQSVSTAGAIAIGVHDTRPYVVSGTKKEAFAGLQRGGYGNPYDLNTSSGGPLAIEMRDSLARALKARGASPVPVVIAVADSPASARAKLQGAKARRSVLVTLREWKTDTLMRTDFHYDTTVAVFDEGGRELASHTLKGVDGLGLGSAGGEGISQATAKKLDALFEEARVAGALR